MISPRRALTVLALGALASACAAIWGFEDGLPGGVRDGGATDAPNDGALLEGRAPDCRTLTASDMEGIFVSRAQGTADAACGTRAAPCKTVQLGLDRARATPGKTQVYVARGAYMESITLHGGVSVVGGFNLDWSRACSEPSGSVVQIQAVDKAITVTAEDLDTPALLSDLGVLSKPAGPGESLFGVVARGTGTRLGLTDVVIRVSAGGAGVRGPSGDAGAPGAASCPPEDGGPGLAVDASGNGGEGGAFVREGFVSAAGARGDPGNPGRNGAPGADGGCVTCHTCGGTVVCGSLSSADACGAAGASGCGGGGGLGGGGGGGGGSSVALYVWDAQVNLARSALSAGGGGNGALGGGGGPGAQGGTGARGNATTTCFTACGGVLGSCGSAPASAEGGAGTSGGTGAPGARGGAGGGGFSYALYTNNSDKVKTDDRTTLTHGEPGLSEGNGSTGRSADRGP